MDIQGKSLIELKAMFYDLLVAEQKLQQDKIEVNNAIAQKEKE